MKNLLVITQKVDENDDLLGFFIGWLEKFAAKFDKIFVITLAKGRYALPANIEVYSLGKEKNNSRFARFLIFYFLLFRLVPKSSGILAHMSPIFAVASWPAAFIFRKKIILWYLHRQVTFRLKLAERLCYKIATASKESLGIYGEKIVEFGHGIDASRFATHRDWDHRGLLKIISVGRISPIKNFETLIGASSILKKEGINFHLKIIGRPVMKRDFPYFDHLKDLVAKSDLKNNIDFTGFVPYNKMAHHYKEADFCIGPLPTGGIDKAMLEAMAAGCIILTSNDVFKKYLGEYSDMLIFSNPENLAIKLKKLYFLPGPKKQDISNFLEESVKKDHDLTSLINNISALFNEKNKILITGYTYVDEASLKTFDFYPAGDAISFLVPEKWSLKDGKHIFIPPQKENIRTTKAFFSHSHYPIIGGLLKGWMPIFPFVVFKQRPHIIYSATEPNLLTTLYQGIFAKVFGAKHIIFTWENVPYNQKFRGLRGGIQKIIVKLNLLFCDGVICGNIRGQKIINSLTDKPTIVMPLCGVDSDFFRPDRSQKSFRGINFADNIVFAFIGAIGYRKGIHLIIRAFSELLKDFPEIRLFIAGSGEYEKEINSMIRESGSASSITRVSWMDRSGVREALNSSDVFLYPSIPYKGWEEQFGYSIAEAALMELPVIATKSGSMSEVILDGKTGILVEPNNYNALKQAMEKLIKNETERRAMGKAGREFIKSYYDNEVIAKKFHQFFHSI